MGFDQPWGNSTNYLAAGRSGQTISKNGCEVEVMVDLYWKGRVAEKKIVNYLRERGFINIRRSAGSRGYADIYAKGPSGAKFYIQAKSGGARATGKEIRGLRALARKRQGWP